MRLPDFAAVVASAVRSASTHHCRVLAVTAWSSAELTSIIWAQPTWLDQHVVGRLLALCKVRLADRTAAAERRVGAAQIFGEVLPLMACLEDNGGPVVGQQMLDALEELQKLAEHDNDEAVQLAATESVRLLQP